MGTVNFSESKLKDVLNEYVKKRVLTYSYYSELNLVNVYIGMSYNDNIEKYRILLNDDCNEKSIIDVLKDIVERHIKEWKNYEIAKIILSEKTETNTVDNILSLNDIAKKVDEESIKAHWHAEFANNGWIDWFCPHCKQLVANMDVHINLDWKYCPYCGKKVK